MKTTVQLFIITLVAFIASSELMKLPTTIKERTYNNRYPRSEVFWWVEKHANDISWQTTHVSENLLGKVRKGLPVTIVNIGGSNSAGGGLENSTQMYINLIADWWNKTYESPLAVHNIAIGGTGSDYFLFCLQNHLSVDEQPDIILLELAVNDFGYQYGYTARPMELLTRRLLSLPSSPMLIYINFVSEVGSNSLKPINVDCLNMQDLGYDELAMHYGIPAFSIKNFGCPLTDDKRRLNASNAGIFAADGVHAGIEANSKMALMITEYLNKEFSLLQHKILYHNEDHAFSGKEASSSIRDYIKKLFNSRENKQTTDHTEQLKKIVKPLFIEPSITDDQLAYPMCWSHLTHNVKTTNRQTLRADVTKSRGFRYISTAVSKNLSIWHESHRLDAYPGWRAMNNNVFIPSLQIQFYIPSNGPNKLYSVSLILRLAGGRDIYVNISLDSKIVKQAQLVKNCGQIHQESYIYPIATNVLPGNHTIDITSTLGKIAVNGLIVGYPGFHGYVGYKPTSTKYLIWSIKQYKTFSCWNYNKNLTE